MSKQETSFLHKHDYNLFAQDCFSEEGANRLRSYLGKIEKGQSQVFTAPFANDTPISIVMNDWLDHLESIRSEWPSLWDFEIDLSSKVGPLSIQKPMADRIADVRHYYEDILLSSEPIAAKAIQMVCDEFAGVRGLRVRNEYKTVDKMKLSTNSGAPFFTKRRKVIPDTVPVKFHRQGYSAGDLDMPIVHSLFNERNYRMSAVIGWRGQEGGPSKSDVKQRVVWMFPFAINILELSVYQPLIEGAQKLDLVPAWVSMESVDKRITQLFDSKGSKDLVVCTDFSKFDQHFNRHMQFCSYLIIANMLTRSAGSINWLNEVFPIKYNIPLCWKMEGDFVHCFGGKHGMASGSGGTNVDETLAHRALQYEAALRANEVLNPNSQCLGDDGILSYPGINVEDVVEAYSSHGQEMNVTKQYASTQDCVYLRRWHHTAYRPNGECVGVYSTCRALGRLRYLERYMDPEDWDKESVALRQLSIIENCKWHPLFTDFIQFCMKRDKYRLGLDIPGFLDDLVTKVKERIEHMPDFMGYTKTLQGFKPEGILNWEVVKYLKSLR